MVGIMAVDLTLFWISIGCVFVIVSLFYMISRILKKTEFEIIAKSEFKQAIISIAICFGALALASVFVEVSKAAMTDVVKAQGLQQSETMWFDYSENYIRGLTVTGTKMLVEFWTIGFTLRHMKLGSLSLKNPLVPAITFSVVTGVSEILGRYIEVLDMLFSFFVGSLNVQLILLQFFKAIAIEFILPAGIILRAIPPTRSGGSFLIALAFGLYIVFPFGYVVSGEVSKTVWEEYKKLPQPSKTLIEVAFPSIPQTFSTLFNLFDSFSLLIPQATIIPLFVFTITIAFVNSFTEFIREFD